MTNNNANTAATENSHNGLSTEAIDKAVKALISLSSSAKEADKIVCEFKPEFSGQDTTELLKVKYVYVRGLFDIREEVSAACNAIYASDFEKAATDYYSLLSVLILRKWG